MIELSWLSVRHGVAVLANLAVAKATAPEPEAKLTIATRHELFGVFCDTNCSRKFNPRLQVPHSTKRGTDDTSGRNGELKTPIQPQSCP